MCINKLFTSLHPKTMTIHLMSYVTNTNVNLALSTILAFVNVNHIFINVNIYNLYKC
jgi:hypothetical protein